MIATAYRACIQSSGSICPSLCLTGSGRMMSFGILRCDRLSENHPRVSSVTELRSLAFVAVEVIKVRATAMQKASQAVDSGMMSVVLNADHKLNLAMMCAQKYCTGRIHIENPVCQVANYLYTTCRVLAGHSEVSKRVCSELCDSRAFACCVLIPTALFKRER